MSILSVLDDAVEAGYLSRRVADLLLREAARSGNKPSHILSLPWRDTPDDHWQEAIKMLQASGW